MRNILLSIVFGLVDLAIVLVLCQLLHLDQTLGIVAVMFVHQMSNRLYDKNKEEKK